MIEISGKGTIYSKNQDKITKVLCIGNSSASKDQESTFGTFTFLAKTKMILSMIMAPAWITDRIVVKQEVFLIFNIMGVLLKDWGKDKYLQSQEDFAKLFCETATKEWGITVRDCDSEQDIQKAFSDIVEGTVSPKECIVLDVAKAVEHRMK